MGQDFALQRSSSSVFRAADPRPGQTFSTHKPGKSWAAVSIISVWKARSGSRRRQSRTPNEDEANRLWALKQRGQWGHGTSWSTGAPLTPLAICVRGIRVRADPSQVEAHCLVEAALRSQFFLSLRRRDFRS